MELEAAIAQNRARVDEFIAATHAVAGTWTTPVHPGKWSPAEVAEHIHIAYTASADLARDAKSAFPNFPFFLRALARKMAFEFVMKNGRFPRRVKTFKSFVPMDLAQTPEAAAGRLRAAVASFEAAVRARGDRPIRHPVFGTVSGSEWVIFEGHHTKHHEAQLGAGAAATA